MNEFPSPSQGAVANSRSLILRQAAEVAAGRTSSVERLAQCLTRITDPRGEGKRTFITFSGEQAHAVAGAQDTLIRHGYAASPLAGVAVSVKDLLDVQGEVTRAGAVALDDAPPAAADAPVVRRLKAAGAVLIGRTNMTQFAFSVVGLNPFFGAPGNPWDRERIPGGSSSGAAVSVADGMAVAAIGSDTVGSIRVPAALCGIVGYKPTQSAVPREGCVPLSTSLDSIGPMARSVEDCALVHAVIAGEPLRPLIPAPVQGLRLAVPREIVLDDLDEHVAGAFARAVTRLSRAGALVSDEQCEPIAEAHALNGNAIIQPVEALAWHRELLARRGDDYDPQIRARVETGRTISGADYAAVLARRRELMAGFDAFTDDFDAVMLPTVPVIAPTRAECERDETGLRSRLLRNCAPFNFLDRCAISIPINEPGDAPVGLMLVGERGGDRRLLEIAAAVEALLASTGGA